MRVLAILLLGCASNGPGISGGSVSGQMPGGIFQPADAISASITISDGAGGTSSNAQIQLASTPHLCSDAGASPAIVRKGQRYLTIELRDVNGATTTTPTAPGTYMIYPDTGSEPPKSASLLVGALDQTCQSNDADSAKAQSGTVTLATLGGGAFTGSFDVTLNTGDHLTGTFDPEPCTALAATTTSTNSPTCL